tara:strand:+ start:2349 stop:3983 length:1635 start_codon:yes stop_codon:yes gene_type:complete
LLIYKYETKNTNNWGGIGGLSCATSLAETGKFDISIYESDIIGGQASTKKSKLCNTEICWRVWGCSYNNLFRIMNDISCMHNFYNGLPDDLCYSFKQTYNLTLSEYFTLVKYKLLHKSIKFLFDCKERNINAYHNLEAYNYFEQDSFHTLLLGPLMGLEPTKLTVSALLKFIYGLEQVDNNFCKKGSLSLVNKCPTSEALFEPWKKYLIKRNVKIYEKYSLKNVICDNNGKISQIIINNEIYSANEIVFACSLKPLINIFNKSIILKNTIVNKKINNLNLGHQLYISVNFYWKQQIIKKRKCHAYIFEGGWFPILVKKFYNTDYVEKNCNSNIKEVWNIAVADYLLGNYIKKFSSQCTFEEIVYEIKMNIQNSKHFKEYFDFENNTWDDYFYDYEFDDRYEKQLPTAYKFSINKGIENNLLNNQEPELGNNIYFSAYYVKNTTGGAGMETSCEIGLTTADLICKKYNIKNPRKPILKTHKYLTLLTSPLVLFDSLLYSFNIRPITEIINPLLLLIIYCIIILIIFIVLIILISKVLYQYFKKHK